jgi:ribonuclease P protein component
LKLSREFQRVREKGKAVRGGLFLLGLLRVEGETNWRVGLVTSRRIGGAVVRNRVRRRLREIVRRDQGELHSGYWFVLVARPAAARANTAELEAEWRKLARRGGLLRDAESVT